MNRLTKVQVLALFLGSSKAIEPLELLNGPGSADRIPEGQRITKLSSGTVCNGNADCPEKNEQCGNFQRTGFTPINICVNSSQKCGAIGRIDGTAFSLTCWGDAEDGLTAIAPPVIEPDAFMAGIEKLITKTNVSWDGIQNMIVSSRYNYQDGWWILEPEANKWVENDKPADNRCFLDMQCDPNECCATYPDTNNRRCIDKSLHKKVVSYGPVTFSPICNSEIQTPQPIPEPVDYWLDALSEAVEKLKSVKESQLKDSKKETGYDSMTKEEQLQFDQELQAKQDRDDQFVKELQKIIGYDDEDCSNECRSKFQSELLKWEKNVYEICHQNPKGVDCITAQDIRKEEEKARQGQDSGKNYYKDMSNEERGQYDKERKAQIEQIKASLIALQREKSKPNPGEEGGSCVDVKCASINHCCGTSTPKLGQQVRDKLDNVCGNKIMRRYENSFGEEYDHVCSEQMATKLIGVFAAVATIAISLI